MTIDLTKLDRALDKALEAAVDHALWPGVLDDIVEATGIFAANIIPVTARSPEMIITTERIRPAFETYFAEGWHEREWRMRAVPLLMRDGTARDQQYTSREEFARHDYYRFQARHGVGRTCIIGFSSPEDFLGMTLHRTLDDDFFSNEEARVFQMMRERLMMSTTMMRRLSASKVEGMSEAFETSGVAAIFFDRLCRVTRATSAAEQLLGQELHISNRQLCSRDYAQTAAIQRRMGAIISEQWLRPDGSRGIIVIPREHKRPLLLRIQRLGGNLPQLFAHSTGVCIIEDLDDRPQIEAQSLRQLFDLTASEASIAVLVAQGMPLRAVADNHSMAYETVRSHLKSVFKKTDTGRQAELTALISRIGFIDPKL